jgi:serine/threonine protein phosphatase PrpC
VPGPNGAALRLRTRLARGPLTIGEAAPGIEPQLAAGDLYRPDTIADGGTAYGLTIRAASVRGLAKRYDGGPRQDDLCLRRHDPTGTLVVAVADGVSGAARSDLGAALAVRHAVAGIARQLDGGDAELDFAEVFEHAAWALVEQHRRDSGDPEASLAAATTLATTLLVAVITADSGRVQLAAVGDSPALLLAGGAVETVLGEPEDADGLVGGPVAALPRAAGQVRRGECRLAQGGVLLICTDGLSLPLGDGRTELGATLARELARPPDVVDFARLLDFNASTYDDDRTLVAVWPAALA